MNYYKCIIKGTKCQMTISHIVNICDKIEIIRQCRIPIFDKLCIIHRKTSHICATDENNEVN